MSLVPDPERIAHTFRAFVPEERFRKFVRVLNTTARAKGRLLAWQEFLWARFAATLPDAPKTFDEIASALCICPVHLRRMSMEAVPVEYGDRSLPPQLVQARDELFPFANYMVHGPGWVEQKPTELVPVCRDCRRALDQWNASHRIPFGMPRFTTSSDWEGDYFVVSDVFEYPRGLALAGQAADPDAPWPKVGQVVELCPPDGEPYITTILDIDRSIMRSCFSDGSAQRAILIPKDPRVPPPVRGTCVRAQKKG